MTASMPTTTERPAPALSPVTAACRGLGIMLLAGASLGLLFGQLALHDPLQPLMLSNTLPKKARALLLVWIFGYALAVAAIGAVSLIGPRVELAARAARLHGWARRLAILSPLGLLPLLFQWQAWRGRDMAFLVLVAVFALGMWAAAAVTTAAPPFSWEERLWAPLHRLAAALGTRISDLGTRLPTAIVVTAAVSYTLLFSYYTLCFFLSGRSSYDLGIYDNLLWNLVHGGPFFKATPRFGSVFTSHFGLHAEPLAYVLAPFYAIVPSAGTLLVLQSMLLGMAAVPLYLVARRHTAPWPACLLAVAYLLFPALHGENIFEFHFLPLGPFFLWFAWYFLETRRDIWAAVFVVLTLSVREDVAAWVAVLGAYLLISGRRPKAGLIVAAAGVVYFGLIKFVIMPHFAGGESFADVYQGLIPPGEHGFGAVVGTLLLNPGFTAGTMIDTGKLIYAMQLLLPLVFLPLRGRLWLLLLLPGILFTMLSTNYGPVISINFQYSAHWVAFIFPAAALAMQRLATRPDAPAQRPLRPALVALLCATIPISYQYGAILQHNTALGGPIPYVFGMNEVGTRRYQAWRALVKTIPPRAKVACSGFTTPWLSNRPDAYNMTMGIFDAEYIFFPTVTADFILNERDLVAGLLRSGEFGVVQMTEPFAVARRGHPTTENVAVLSKIGY